jgi:hypothetical protein
MNWVHYLLHLTQGDQTGGLPYFKRLANLEISKDPPESYISKFQNHPINVEALRKAKEKIAEGNDVG